REHPRQHVATMLATLIPERLAQAMTVECGAEGYSGSLSHLARTARHDLAQLLASMPIEVTGTRGYSHAEATAGGIDLREVDVRTMESRVVAGMHLCGEILDVDGRIGGFNFQWAWSSGYLAGRGAAAAI
ncbi:MAG: NAD(P)/FAD-dependent oxidoreductase, partial [Candidatus Zixiibacteriota bacterium]